MNISFHTLGCKLNFAETSAIANRFRAAGHTISERHAGADVLVINTCAVTDIAEKKCRSAIRQARRNNPDAIIVAAGCFSQISPEVLASMEEVDIVVGNEHKYQLVEIIEQYHKSDKAWIDHTNILKTRVFTPGFSLIDRTRTFLKIQDGCNYGCTYCTIPKARGRSRSGKVSEIVQLVKDLETKGVQEIVLTGVNVGDFGRPHGENLTSLLQEIVSIKPWLRIRLGSVEPELLSDEIIRLVADSPCLMPHFHLPLQSGDDEVLRAMKRKYTTHLFGDRVEKIRELLPDAFIAVDVIAGFPGESETMFENSLRFIEGLPLSWLHVFTYSERKNTQAITITPKVPPAEIKQRGKMLQKMADQKKIAFNQSFIGSTRPVLFESDRHEGMIQGFTDNYIRVLHPYDADLVNQIKQVRLLEIHPGGVLGILEPEFSHRKT
ncbi:MAG TPA: tRNA (N(6)-L-threonylcarbamoyladenosine(37)-C(2))-methylthiotransferase MtaB [Bacteroidales bacterium]|nr:tRNA (N(6)-L-threonylcarbamoyladenosine(37)-C(2))-methylthiotransferase MtaB [Bacteroidales bacterium]HRZ49118.1 tRNA (N(6)-L-threonylcarbamoyladenosine(37)-C(2))-methylthiotransferase MtaB [Bacteroidales bacterium]